MPEGWLCLLREVIIYRPRDIGLEFFSWILAPKIACGLYTGVAYLRGFTVVSLKNSLFSRITMSLQSANREDVAGVGDDRLIRC